MAPRKTPIHFHVPRGLRGDPRFPQLVSSLSERGVSGLWFDIERELVRDTLKTISGAAAGAAANPGSWGVLAGLIALGAGGGRHAGGPERTPLHDVLLEVPCLDWRGGFEREKVEELVRVRDALLERGVNRVFLHLIHPDPVLNFNYSRLLKERLNVPLVVSLDDEDELAAALSAGPLLSEGTADVVLVRPGPPRDVFGDSEFESFAGRPVDRARRILGMLGLHPRGYELISCPTCGRCGLDVEKMARETDARMRALEEELRREGKDLASVGGITVAVMGCNVNGPGEAKAADAGIAGGKNGRGALFVRGTPVKTLPVQELVNALMGAVKAILEERFGSAGKAARKKRRGKGPSGLGE